METYPETYERYKKFAVDRNCPFWDYPTWMQKKDEPPKSKYQATLEFIQQMEKLTKV